MDDDEPTFAPIRKSWQATSGLPTSSDARRAAARKKTKASQRAAKRIANGSGGNGIHKRRNRRSDG